MTYTEFRILCVLKQNPGITQRKIAQSCQMSLGAANIALKALRSRGLVDDSLTVTQAGLYELSFHKVNNAVIMAAGLSSRFAPISYEHPKGTLKVKGEVLIERQIRQLQEAGIHDIVVVVGYKKEEFFYLEDEFGVTIVLNNDYMNRNNNSTIKKVANILGNTYICSSDNYFTQNPFEEYVYDSYYASVYHKGYINEYCLETKGRAGTIVNAVFGGSDAWITMGHAYWDRAFAKKFLEILDDVYDDHETAGKLWEDIYAEHIHELPMRIRKYPDGVIWEFDSLDELRAFDPHFIENVDSSILDNICETLGCARADVESCVPINQGLTNLSVRFTVNGDQYVYRHPGAGTSEIINRESEAFSQEIARKLGIDRTFVHEDPITGWKISRFIEGCIPFDYHDAQHVEAAMEIARKLHGSDAQSPWSFDVYKNATEIIDLLDGATFTDLDDLAARAKRLSEHVALDGVAPVLCHNDFYGPNFLVHDKGVDLIDWEYSAMSDYASDLGTFVCCSDYGIEEAHDVFAKYFGRETTAEEERHCMAFVALCAFYWFVWALYKDKTSDPVGEWLYMWYRSAKTFSSYALTLYE